AGLIWLVHRYWPTLWSQAMPPGFGLASPHRRAWPVVALAVGLLAPFVGGLVTRVLAGDHDITQNVQQLAQHAPLAWRVGLAAMAITLAPLVEELLFRGVLLSSLIPRCGVALAALLSAAAFAAIHLPGLGWQWYACRSCSCLAWRWPGCACVTAPCGHRCSPTARTTRLHLPYCSPRCVRRARSMGSRLAQQACGFEQGQAHHA